MSVHEGKVCLVGAGLGNGILAWFLRKRHPHIRVEIFEAKPHMTDNRTWSFHGTDVTAESRAILRELIVHQWPGYEVQFPHSKRVLQTEYLTMTPERLQRELINAGVEIHFSSPVKELHENHIVTKDEQKLVFDCVFDGRGFQARQQRMGYQKFVGQIVRLKQPHGLKVPILMDAMVEQKDGFRFFYTLPFSERNLLIEDTRYSIRNSLDIDEYFLDIRDYLASCGWETEAVLKTEKGILPIPLTVEPGKTSSVELGLKGGFFHPVTGYSLPDSVRLADRITRTSSIHPSSVKALLSQYRQEYSVRKKFYLMLNRMMFLAAKDEERRKIFEHFYTLPQGTIERFYSGGTTFPDGLRILSGKPPVAIGSAMRALLLHEKKEII